MKRESLKKTQYHNNMYRMEREIYKKNIKLYIVKDLKRKSLHKNLFAAREFDNHGQINYTDTKAKCRHLKNLM